MTIQTAGNTCGRCEEVTPRRLRLSLCDRCYNADYRAKNREHLRAYKKRWIQATPGRREQIRDYLLQRRYGISQQQYDELCEAQNACCAICSESKEAVLHVDHDHATGKIRGLLCSRCNTALGAFGDDLEGVLRVVAYLRRDA